MHRMGRGFILCPQYVKAKTQWVFRQSYGSGFIHFCYYNGSLVEINGNSREAGKYPRYCRFWVNPSPCQGHRRENFNCWYTFDGCDSRESKKTCLYCRFRVNISTMTVQSPENVLATAVFEYLQSQNAVARAGFSGFDCHQAIEIWHKWQYYRRLLLLLLSVQKNHLLKWQYEYHVFGYVL